MRVLVLTNHFAEFAGSEIVALQIAKWFADRGDDVVLGANLVRGDIQHHATGMQTTADVSALRLADFDLVWCQHDLLSLFSLSNFEEAALLGALPHVALVSLSPFEPYEHLNGVLARVLFADVYANSLETAAELVRRQHGLLRASRVHVFHNAAPAEFWSPPSPPSALRTLMLVSNHPPAELLMALDELESGGVRTLRVGLNRDYRLLRPSDIGEVDAVVTIGKTAIYAIAQQKPVYMYDMFGGDGWLSRVNLTQSMAYNFSGRPNCRHLDATLIASEIRDQFPAAWEEARRLHEVTDFRLLHLDQHLEGLRARAASRRKGRRSEVLQRALRQPWFRAHLETNRMKSIVMKNNYLHANQLG